MDGQIVDYEPVSVIYDKKEVVLKAMAEVIAMKYMHINGDELDTNSIYNDFSIIGETQMVDNSWLRQVNYPY